MTEDDLVEDLSRLLREGLVVAIDADQPNAFDEYLRRPRFYVTPSGRAQLDEPVDAPEDRR